MQTYRFKVEVTRVEEFSWTPDAEFADELLEWAGLTDWSQVTPEKIKKFLYASEDGGDEFLYDLTEGLGWPNEEVEIVGITEVKQ